MLYLPSKGGYFVTSANGNQLKKIDKSIIVQAALELLDEEGIRQLTMRKVADRLNIKGASLYWHFQNKNELLALIAEEICKQIQLPDEDRPWEEQLLDLSDQLRKTYLSVRDSAHVMEETIPSTPYRISLIEKVSGIFAQSGLENEDLFSASWMFNNYVTSFVIEEYRIKSVEEDGPPGGIELPFAVRIPDMDREFRFGMEVLINGLKSKVRTNGERSGEAT